MNVAEAAMRQSLSTAVRRKKKESWEPPCVFEWGQGIMGNNAFPFSCARRSFHYGWRRDIVSTL